MHVQIVLFKLRADASREAFLRLTRQMVDWLKTREGFVAYEIYEGADGWSDRIAWQTARHAEAGRSAFVQTPIARELIALVAEGHTSFFGEARETA